MLPPSGPPFRQNGPSDPLNGPLDPLEGLLVPLDELELDGPEMMDGPEPPAKVQKIQQNKDELRDENLI